MVLSNVAVGISVAIAHHTLLRSIPEHIKVLKLLLQPYHRWIWGGGGGGGGGISGKVHAHAPSIWAKLGCGPIRK